VGKRWASCSHIIKSAPLSSSAPLLHLLDCALCLSDVMLYFSVVGQELKLGGTFTASINVPDADMPADFSLGASLALTEEGTSIGISGSLLRPFRLTHFPWISFSSMALTASFNLVTEVIDTFYMESTVRTSGHPSSFPSLVWGQQPCDVTSHCRLDFSLVLPGWY